MSQPAIDSQLILNMQQVCKDLQDAQVARLRDKIKIYPCHTNRASQMAHPCDAFGYFNRTAWEKKQPHDYTLQSIFNEGNLHEPAIIQEIMDDCARLGEGWNFVGQQQDFHDRDMNVSGHVDGILIVPGNQYAGSCRIRGEYTKHPVEIKTMSPHIWDSIHTDMDILYHSRPYVQGYYGQLQAYLYLSASESGFWVLKNKLTGMRKYVPTILDYDYCDEMFKRVARINKAVKENIVPEKIMDDKYCENCAFRTVCLGDKVFEIPKINNERLLEAIISKEEWAPAKQKYGEACDTIKEECSKSEEKKFRVGNFRITRCLTREKEIQTYTRKEYWTNRIRMIEE